MKRSITLIAMLIAASAAVFAQVRVSTPNIEMVLKAEKGGNLRIQYFGGRLSDADVANLDAAGIYGHDLRQAQGPLRNCSTAV